MKPLDASSAPKILVNSYNNLLKIFKSNRVLSPRSMRYRPFGAEGIGTKK